ALFDVAERANPVVADLVRGAAAISTHLVDATRRAAVDREMARVVGRFGAPTILINNAGLGSSPSDTALETGAFERYPESAWDAMITSHLKTMLVASQAFLARFKADRAGAGSIINISSTYGLVSPDQSVYADRRQDGGEYYKPVGYSVAKS